MIEVLGEHYYFDLDEVEKYLDMSDDLSDDLLESGNTFSQETRINIITYPTTIY